MRAFCRYKMGRSGCLNLLIWMQPAARSGQAAALLCLNANEDGEQEEEFEEKRGAKEGKQNKTKQNKSKERKQYSFISRPPLASATTATKGSFASSSLFVFRSRFPFVLVSRLFVSLPVSRPRGKPSCSISRPTAARLTAEHSFPRPVFFCSLSLARPA